MTITHKHTSKQPVEISKGKFDNSRLLLRFLQIALPLIDAYTYLYP